MAQRTAPAVLSRIACSVSLLCAAGTPAWATAPVVVISLDGATPRLIEAMITDGTLPVDRGLGLLMRHGLHAERNETVVPSLTAVGHIAIATGSTAARNDVVSNSFHLCASPFRSNISGFAAPIGGHGEGACGHDGHPTAEPLWIAARAAGKRVVTATWPGGDGADIKVPGIPTSPVIDPAARRTVDYTVPFGAFAGLSARGHALSADAFEAAPAGTLGALSAAGRRSFSPARQTRTPFESFTVTGVAYALHAVALDSTDDGQVNYDTLVVFDATRGLQAGPFALPATGPAWMDTAERRSALFYLEGTAAKAGTGFFLSRLAPDLSSVRLIRYGANAIPRNDAVLADVDDINSRVGFWAPQPDYRLPERLAPGLETFDDAELEAAYGSLVQGFVDYQTRVAERAIERNPGAHLSMFYIEQPDGSEHQYLLTDARQPTDIRNPGSILEGQDLARRARYLNYVRSAYRTANEAVHRILQKTGLDASGRPLANVFVVSDHGMSPFHTAVDLGTWLAARGFDPAKVRAVTSGPSANIYINLRGREPDGVVEQAEYLDLQRRLVTALQALTDTNPAYRDPPRRLNGPDGQQAHPLAAKTNAPAPGPSAGSPQSGGGQPVFQFAVARPAQRGSRTPVAAPHRDGSVHEFGQDSGDVFALLNPGYNFDGIQTPAVVRRGDAASDRPVLSLPNFYGAHGYDPRLPEMSAIFVAAGPDVCAGRIRKVHNIDIAPTVLGLLGVQPAATVQGRAIPLCGHDRKNVEGGADRDSASPAAEDGAPASDAHATAAQ